MNKSFSFIELAEMDRELKLHSRLKVPTQIFKNMSYTSSIVQHIIRDDFQHWKLKVPCSNFILVDKSI